VRRAPAIATIVAVAAGACAVAAAPAGATNECRGLQVCVPVAGPWVVASPGRVEFQLSCPRRYIVAGLDAELTVRGIDVGFVGSLGSPVNPGITTSSEAVFLGRLVRGGNAASSFRPHIGCVPASGGGQRTPTAYHPFPPGKPTTRRVVELHVHPGAATRIGRCTRNERLIGATHAVGFFGDAPPTPALVRAVKATHRIRNGAAVLTVRAGAAVAGTRTVVQLDLVCAPR
jgi:hypothetical protein